MPGIVCAALVRRNGYIALGAVVLVWAVLAVVLGSPSLRLGSGSSTASVDSPACLPSTLGHTAALPGTSVEVSPAPEAQSANPRTQISFLGAPAAQISDVSVVGARSGTIPAGFAPTPRATVRASRPRLPSMPASGCPSAP